MTEVYKIWEIGRHGAPPAVLVQALQPSERLLWAAEVPISRFVMRRVWMVMITVPATFFFIQIAPWGQSMAEYCSGEESSSCRKLYLFVWPGIIAFIHLSVSSLFTLWKAKTQPWLNYLGVTSAHAVMINGNKPDKPHRHSLARDCARIDWAGAVRFDKAKAVIFVGLDVSDAKRAVYWANEGRRRPEFQNGSTT